MNGHANPPPERMIAHADMDAFYASVEQLDNPELRGRPVIVAGSSRRSVVSSASYEARKFGVRAAMPSIQAHQLCPHGIFVRGRMERYVEISRLVRQTFEAFSPLVEPLSLDEAFIDLTGTERLFGIALEAGRALKRRVFEHTGLVVSVGIAPIKMVAKILSDMSKPDGLLALRNMPTCRSSASAVATGLAYAGIGSCTGGSIRWPAHCYGIVGLKPTRSRVC